jgi:actin cytoskeleton-regulatory complex protein SLA1
MSDEQEEYLAVLKASYDYTPQSEDEIEIKEDQLLLLIEKTDDECVIPCAAHYITNYS